jgi:O-antigen ligase
MIGVGWLVSRSGYSTKEMSFLFGLTIISGVPPLLWGGYELYYLESKPFLQLHSVGHVNHSAIYLTMLFGASLGWMLALWSRLSAMNKSLMALVSSLFFVSLIIGQSRAALGVGMLIALVLIVFLTCDKKIKLGAILCLTIFSLSAVVFNAEIVKKELVQEKNNDFLSGRDKVWNVSLEAARFHPLLGIGMSNWGYIKKEYIKKSLTSRGESYDPTDYYTHPGHSHSLYLTALVDRGFVGLLMTFIFLIYWIQYIRTTFNLTKISSQAAYLWSGSISALLVTFGIGLVNTTFHHEHGILACLFLGLHINYCRTIKKAQNINSL